MKPREANVRWFWSQVEGNILAMPLEALISVLAAAVFRKPLRWFLRWLRQEESVALTELRRLEHRDRQPADLGEQVTRTPHPGTPA